MNYEVYGPHEVPRNQRLIASRPIDTGAFWEEVEDQEEGLSHACGCYVFSIRGIVCYVGLAEKQSFRSECFTPHKINQYNEALQAKQGRPELILLAKLTPTDRFAKPSGRGHRDIRLLENLLIGSALRRNSNLQNVRGTMLLREMCVPRVLNTRRGQGRSGAVQALRKSLGV